MKKKKIKEMKMNKTKLQFTVFREILGTGRQMQNRTV